MLKANELRYMQNDDFLAALEKELKGHRSRLSATLENHYKHLDMIIRIGLRRVDPPQPTKPHAGSLLTGREAAAYLNVTYQCLPKWRSEGRGPAYRRMESGTIRYSIEDLDAYAERVDPEGEPE